MSDPHLANQTLLVRCQSAYASGVDSLSELVVSVLDAKLPPETKITCLLMCLEVIGFANADTVIALLEKVDKAVADKDEFEALRIAATMQVTSEIMSRATALAHHVSGLLGFEVKLKIMDETPELERPPEGAILH